VKWFAAVAQVPGGVAKNVLIEAEHGVFTAVTPNAHLPLSDDVTRLPGVVLPGFANAHSHAFHRALRGQTHHDGGTFWTWRKAMYDVASRLNPDTYYALARATYAEMALAGITAVGEFITCTTVRTGCLMTTPTPWATRWPRQRAMLGFD